MVSVPQWQLRGDWFDVCKCAIPCPCSWAQPPTYGDCDGVLAWHIREGHYGDVQLDGLNVMMLGHFVGNVWAEHSDTKLGIFMDERADERQREALQAIFGGQAGGWPAQFGEIVGGDVVGFEFASIRVEVSADLSSWSAEVPNRVRASAEVLTGPTTGPGLPVQVHNLPGAEVGPGAVATWGRATADQVDAFGFNWEWSGRSSKHMGFNWAGPGT